MRDLPKSNLTGTPRSCTLDTSMSRLQRTRTLAVNETSYLLRDSLTISRIDVEKSSSHHLSQFEIGGDNPCSRHLSGIVPVDGPTLEWKLSFLIARTGKANFSLLSSHPF
jgi:hypothetical protein